MLVSVIIPFLDAKDYLPEAVASVYAQTFKDWELLLVDDGSGDGSSELARAIAERDPARVQCLHHEDQGTHGASATRNLGLAGSSGELIAFLDADDIWLPGKLTHQLEAMGAHPHAAMTFARVRYFRGEPGRGMERDQPFAPLHDGVYSPPSLTLEFLRDSDVYPCPSATLIRRAPLLAVGGFELRFKRVRTDLAVWVKLTSRYPALADSSVVTLYRQHANSSVARLLADEKAFVANELAFVDWLLIYLESLPKQVRAPLEPVACKQMFRLTLEDVLRQGHRGALAWRYEVLRRLRQYPAFRRGARLARLLSPARIKDLAPH